MQATNKPAASLSAPHSQCQNRNLIRSPRGSPVRLLPGRRATDLFDRRFNSFVSRPMIRQSDEYVGGRDDERPAERSEMFDDSSAGQSGNEARRIRRDTLRRGESQSVWMADYLSTADITRRRNTRTCLSFLAQHPQRGDICKSSAVTALWRRRFSTQVGHFD